MASVTDILMYHSVSAVGGATAIPSAVFAMQMRVLAESGLPVLDMDQWLAAREAGHLPPRSVVITFDDGFQDFADVAWPEMSRYGFRPIVYLPTDFVGRAEGWKGIGSPPRGLMGWNTIGTLAGQGVLFGSHTVSHADLTSLDEQMLDLELTQAKSVLEQRLDRRVRHFAPPYGLSSNRERAHIARHYRTSVSTRLAQAQPGDDFCDLPRLEMFYFTDEARWRAHLAGRGRAYLTRRKLLRRLKAAIMKPWAGL